jgi:hypothetical protein
LIKKQIFLGLSKTNLANLIQPRVVLLSVNKKRHHHPNHTTTTTPSRNDYIFMHYQTT